MSSHDLGEAAPVFIGGLSYSGKTQLRQLLENHTNLSLHRRTGLWRYYGRFGDLSLESNRREARKVLESDGVATVLAPDWDDVFDEFEEGDHSYARLFGVVHSQRAAALGLPRWGEQYGGIVRFASAIFASYPAGRIIHMIRHPRGRLMRLVGRPRRPGAIGAETAAGIESLRLAREQKARYGDRYKVLSYERLRQDPEGSINEVCDWIGESPIRHLGESGHAVRFDSEQTTEDIPNKALAFSDLAVPDWPSDDSALGQGGSSRARRMRSSIAWRFPVNAMVMWYRLGPTKGDEER